MRLRAPTGPEAATPGILEVQAGGGGGGRNRAGNMWNLNAAENVVLNSVTMTRLMCCYSEFISEFVACHDIQVRLSSTRPSRGDSVSSLRSRRPVCRQSPANSALMLDSPLGLAIRPFVVLFLIVLQRQFLGGGIAGFGFDI